MPDRSTVAGKISQLTGGIAQLNDGAAGVADGAKNANDATDFFQIPTGRVVEVGTQVTV